MINDWFDFVGTLGLSFLVVVSGVWILPQLSENTHFIVAISILFSSIFFARKQVDFLVDRFERRNIKTKRTGGKK